VKKRKGRGTFPLMKGGKQGVGLREGGSRTKGHIEGNRVCSRVEKKETSREEGVQGVF